MDEGPGIDPHGVDDPTSRGESGFRQRAAGMLSRRSRRWSAGWVNRVPGRSIKDLAYQVVQADSPPTWGMELRAAADDVEDRHSRSVIDLAMRLAESSLTTGASAAEVTAIVLRLTSAYGLRSVHVDVTNTSIVVSHHRGADADPVTAMRTVRSRSEDVSRLTRLQELVSQIPESALTPQQARDRFDAIVAAPAAYNGTVVTVAQGLLGGGVAVLLGASWPAVLVAMVASAGANAAQRGLAVKRLPIFFGQMVGGAIPMAAAVLVVSVRSMVPALQDVSASVVVAAGIVALLAGLSVVGAAQDAIDGYYVTAAARSFEVIVLTMGLVVGILLTLGIGQQLGVVTYVSAPPTAGTPLVQVMAATAIAATFAVSSLAQPRAVLICAGTGALGWAGYLLSTDLGFGQVAASAVAGFGVGLFAQFCSSKWRVPAQAISTAGIVALLPGMMAFRGLYQLVNPAVSTPGSGDGLLTLAEASFVGLALAGGVSLGTYLGRPLRQRRDLFQDRALRRATGRR